MKRAVRPDRQTRADSNRVFRRPGREPEENARARRTRRPARRANHLHPGTVPLAVFLPERRPREFQTGRTHSRPQHRRLSASWRRNTRWSSSPRCSRSAPPAFITTPPRSLTPTARCWASTARCTFPDDPLYYEKFYFTPGDLGFSAWQTRYGKIGVLICWDQWYPEAARLTALQGAEILFYPTAIGWHPREKKKLGERQHAAWETIQRSHAIANGCYVAVANRVGHEKLGGRRHRILGPKLRRRHLRRNPRQGRRGQGRNPDRAG